MKKLLFALLFLCAGMSHAFEPALINRSSFTLTNDSAAIQCNYLDKVIVAVAKAGGFLTIYNSSWTSASTATVISSISLSSVYEYDYTNLKVNGLFYITATNTNGVQILYKK